MTDPSREDAWSAADRHQRSLPLELRKERGTWFTPPALALPTARRALGPLDDGSPLRICDPAVGGGSLLLAAREALQRSPAEFFGLDVDARAAAIARAALGSAQIRRGDGLLELEDGSFDAVLTNPPWETLREAHYTRDELAAMRPRFKLQGSGKMFTYRLFLERAYRLLRPGGRLGIILPASMWFDRDAAPLREMLLDECQWEWLYGFENRARIFDIDSRYRFGVVIATKGGRTNSLRAAFSRTSVAGWQAERPDHCEYPRAVIRELSPHAGTLVEVEDHRDLDLLRRIQRVGRPMLGAEGLLTWRQGDFNMTSDKGRFVLRERAESDGYAGGPDGVWRAADRPDLLPLTQGAMIYDLDANAGAHDRGVGHKTRWRAPQDADELRPLYLVEAEPWRRAAAARPPARIGLRALSNATNERTAIACLLPDVPCGNSVGVLAPAEGSTQPVRDLAAAAAAIASLPFDWALRMRLSGTNLNRFVLTDCVLPQLSAAAQDELAQLALRLCATTTWSAPLWNHAAHEGWCKTRAPACDPEERRALQTRVDVVVADAYGLSAEDVAWITRGEPFAKGFWRIERDLAPTSRRPSRWRAATSGCSPSVY